MYLLRRSNLLVAEQITINKVSSVGASSSHWLLGRTYGAIINIFEIICYKQLAPTVHIPSFNNIMMNFIFWAGLISYIYCHSHESGNP